MSSTYSIQEVDEDGTTTEIGDPVSKLEHAKEMATEHHLSIDGSSKVQVVTETGHVSFEIDATLETEGDLDEEAAVLIAAETVTETPTDEVVVTTPTGRRTRPWTKTDTADWAPKVDGYTLAYKRERIKTAVYRADDKSDWLILDTRDGKEYHSVNTELGRQVTNRLSDEYKAKARAQREEAAAAKRKTREEKKSAPAETVA